LEAEAKLTDALRHVAESEIRVTRLADESRVLTTDTEAMRLAREQAELELVEAQARAAAVTATVAELEDGMQARRAAELDRLTRVVTAHRALIVHVVRETIQNEVDRARRKGSPENVLRWVGTFYQNSVDIYAERFLPIVMTLLAWKGSADNPHDVAKALAVSHCEESERQLRALAEETPPEQFHTELERMITRWEQERPDKAADKVLHDELQYIASYE
jgi:hypothetical protein